MLITVMIKSLAQKILETAAATFKFEILGNTLMLSGEESNEDISTTIESVQLI